MHTINFIQRSPHRLSILIGSRPGSAYTGVTDRELFESAESKVRAVRAFVKRHDPDIVFTIAGMNSEAESFGAHVEMKNGIPVLTQSPLQSNPHQSKLKPIPLKHSPLCTALIDSIRMLSERYAEKPVAATLNGPLTVLGQLLGLDRFLMLSVDNADLLRRLLHPITDRIIELMHAQMDAGARYVHVAEPTGSLLSPRAFAETGLPSIQKLFSHVKVPNHIHMCGDTSAHLDVLAHAGAGAMSVDSMVNMKEAARIFGKHMAVCGNVEATGVLLHGSPEEVESATRSMLKDMASVENYIPASSCGIPAHTPPENIDIFVKTVRSYVDF